MCLNNISIFYLIILEDDEENNVIIHDANEFMVKAKYTDTGLVLMYMF